MDSKIETFSSQWPAKTRTIVFRHFLFQLLWVYCSDDENSKEKQRFNEQFQYPKWSNRPKKEQKEQKEQRRS